MKMLIVTMVTSFDYPDFSKSMRGSGNFSIATDESAIFITLNARARGEVLPRFRLKSSLNTYCKLSIDNS